MLNLCKRPQKPQTFFNGINGRGYWISTVLYPLIHTNLLYILSHLLDQSNSIYFNFNLLNLNILVVNFHFFIEISAIFLPEDYVILVHLYLPMWHFFAPAFLFGLWCSNPTRRKHDATINAFFHRFRWLGNSLSHFITFCDLDKKNNFYKLVNTMTWFVSAVNLRTSLVSSIKLQLGICFPCQQSWKDWYM